MTIANVYVRRIVTMMCCVISVYRIYGQCSIASAVVIPDNGLVALQFSVTGLIDNNLASPTQGICGVEIEFTHEYLGDLTVTLISPSGTSVTLIGPPTTAISPTNLSNWNIDFVQCASAPLPDPGFTPAWSNLQAWQALTPYTGTYHPQSGCLEDFNFGPANGIWQIVVQDHDQFQVGSIASLTLLFCNPAGLACDECNPNAGILSPSSINICSGENIQSSDISVDFGGNVPSPSSYAYEYLLLSGNTILQNGTTFSFTPPAGTYSICSMSYLLSDMAAVATLIATHDYAILSQAINNSIVCAQLSNTCILLDVSAKPDTLVVPGTICSGEVFSYGGQDYVTDGIFYQTHDGPGLCDTVFEIRVTGRNLQVALNMPDTLFCGSSDVSLNAIVSGAPGPFAFQWTTQTGNITSSANGSSITVDQAGQYVLNVSDGICDGAGNAVVFAGPGFPQVFFEGGTITCLKPVININPIFIPSDGTLLWMGPGGFSATQPNISVSVPGTYTLHVTNQAGCTTSKTVNIGIDTATFPIDIIVISKDCQNSMLTLGNTFPERLVRWQWAGPGGFSSNYWRPVIILPGLYTLTGTFANGCTRSGTYLFDGDFSIPDIILPPRDTLNCNEIITLNLSSTAAGVSYSWSGPQGFYSSLPTIQVNQEGNYLGTVTALNGCSISGNVILDLGDDIFDYQVFSDTLTCSKTSVTIGVVAPEADLFDWLNYSGPGDDQSMIDVIAGGVYTLMMTDTNSGCIVIAEIFVPVDVRVPSFNYTTDTISCADPIAELNFVPFAGYTYSSVYWELPDLSIVPGPTLFSGLPGEHRLYGVSPNGCVGVWRIHIPFDTISPYVILETDTLHCRDTVEIISQTLDSISLYQWAGPGIIAPGTTSIEVDKAGWYSLTAIGPNGCPSTYDVLVDSNFTVPMYTLMADSLRCDSAALLTVSTTDAVNGYSWFSPGGQLISSDSFVLVNQPGTYTFALEGLNQCTAYDTLVIAPFKYPEVVVSSDTFTCADNQVLISALVDIGQYTIAWIDMNGDTIGNSLSVTVSDPGPFVASVSGSNACTSRDTVLVPSDTMPPLAVITPVGEIRCKNRDAALDGSASSPVPLIYSWATVGGTILTDPSLVQISVRDTGYYYLEVVRLDNGCRDTDSLRLAEHPDAITQAYVDVMSPECNGDDNASISVTDLQGGVAPLLFQLNGGPLQSSPVFPGLEAGAFLLTVTDAENCVFDTTIVIDPSYLFSVDAGPDVEIFLGESILLSGMTDLVTDQIVSDQWDASGLTLCTDCAFFDVSPFETTAFIFQVTSATGCIKSDAVTVFVKEKGKYFIPNIFSPNGDGINDEIRLYPSPGIEKVVHWIIFDRWGNAVFGKNDFDPADPSVMWNGTTSTGEISNPGVFPYVLEIQLISGKIEVYHGEITLLR